MTPTGTYMSWMDPSIHAHTRTQALTDMRVHTYAWARARTSTVRQGTEVGTVPNQHLISISNLRLDFELAEQI